MKKFFKIQYLRIIVQIIFFILYPGLFALTFTQIGKTYSMLINLSGNPYTLGISLTYALILLLLTTILGRFFCGWMCSFGTMSDFLYYVNKKLFKRKLEITITTKIDYFLKKFKYIILLFIFVLFWTFNFKSSTNLDPWTSFANLIAIPPKLTSINIGFILLLLIIIGDFLIERFFCRYLCPLGAIFSLISKLSIFKIKKPSSECGNCRACSVHCSMKIKLYQVDKVTDGNCISCYKCISVCPKKNANIAASKTTINVFLASAISILAFFGLYKVQNMVSTNLSKDLIAQTSNNGRLQTELEKLNNSNNTQNNVSNDTISYIPTKDFIPGTYEGTARGYTSNITTKVTVSANKIESIKITQINDSPSYENQPIIQIPAQIIEAQTPYVDVVSGATQTSEGIKHAVMIALNKAKK